MKILSRVFFFLFIFLIFAQNIDLFCSKNKKIGKHLLTPHFYIKVGFKGVYFSWTCFPDERVLFSQIRVLIVARSCLRLQ